MTKLFIRPTAVFSINVTKLFVHSGRLVQDVHRSCRVSCAVSPGGSVASRHATRCPAGRHPVLLLTGQARPGGQRGRESLGGTPTDTEPSRSQAGRVGRTSRAEPSGGLLAGRGPHRRCDTGRGGRRGGCGQNLRPPFCLAARVERGTCRPLAAECTLQGPIRYRPAGPGEGRGGAVLQRRWSRGSLSRHCRCGHLGAACCCCCCAASEAHSQPQLWRGVDRWAGRLRGPDPHSPCEPSTRLAGLAWGTRIE